MSYHRVHQDLYPPPGYNPYSPPTPPPPEGYASAPPAPSYEAYPPPPPQPAGYPYPPPPPPKHQPPYEGYQGYFAEGYPPPPGAGGHPQYQQCHHHCEQYHYQEDQSRAGCFSFLQAWLGMAAEGSFAGEHPKGSHCFILPDIQGACETSSKRSIHSCHCHRQKQWTAFQAAWHAFTPMHRKT
ncbi:hypothetical protein V6N13_132998 [Hibiscus sabdariffa]|uniref:Rhodopsin n=1 Tax=Hibiscus sabdariffa TaxID=183260 RepID=A0ABR2PWY9_9ROSI